VNASNARDYLPLVQALADGKVLQVRRDPGNGHRQWFDLDGTCFDLAADQYRIKPEPREIWVNRFPDGHDALTWYETEEAAHRAYGRVGAIQVRYREVIE